MKTGKSKNRVITKIFSVIIGTFILSATASANGSYFNLGTLDVKVADGKDTEYLTEFLAPGESAKRQIQISNFSAENKELLIYATETTDTEKGNFFTKKIGETNKDIGNWISLPVEKLALGPSESALISVNLVVPKNAGVGLHTGAVIVRELKNDSAATVPGASFSVEKGMRVYLNVKGTVVENAGMSGLALRETGDSYIYSLSVQNNGTVIDSQKFTASLKDFFGNTLYQNTLAAETRPGETGISYLEIPKPEYGIYSLALESESGAATNRAVAVIPFWALLAAVFGLVLFASWTRKTTFCPIAVAQKLHYENLFNKLFAIVKSLEFQRSFAYLGLASLVFTVTFSQISLNTRDLKAQLLVTPECTFDMTVKWGDLRGNPYPGNYTQKWQGSIEIPNAKISILEYLHFEHTDQAQLNDDKNILYFNLETGPDNDGLVIKVEPVQSEFPYIYYHNDLGQNTSEFVITDHISSAGVYPYMIGATSFKAELCKNAQMMQELIRLSTMGDLSATPDITADGFSTGETAGTMIPELDNLFMEELPSTPDVLSDFIMDSGYVQKISRIDSTRKIETDNILIRALQATPDILEEISATPDLNFIFIPADTIIFPPMSFSFTEEKVIRQPMGTIIFVQNKEDPWNAFIGTTDFQSLAEDLRIPASSLTIDPGEPVILGKYKVKEPVEEVLIEEPVVETIIEEPAIVLDEVIVPIEPEVPVEEPVVETGGVIFDTGVFEPPAEEIVTPEEIIQPSEITDGFGATEETVLPDESVQPPTEEVIPTEETVQPPTEEVVIPVEEPVQPPTEEPAEPVEPAPSEPAAQSIYQNYFAFNDFLMNIFRLFETPRAYAAPPESNPSSQNKIDAQTRKLEITPDAIEKIKAGEKRSFAGRFDKATLVNVDPTPGEKVIFILQPMLEIRIPAGMPAGTYQGELTITSL